MLIDGHAHIDSEELLPIVEEILRECNIIVVNASVDYLSSIKTIELAKKYDMVIPAIGFHPEFVNKAEEVERVLNLLNYALEVSEVGLDYYWIKDESLRKKEVEVLSHFLESAERLRLPVVIHSRGGNKDLLQILPSYKVKFAIHAFEGSVKDAKRFVDLGGFISLPPIIARDKTRALVAKEVDLSYLLTETDSPFMGAEKGITNRPCEVRRVIEKISELKGIKRDEVELTIEENFKRFFDVSDLSELIKKKKEKISNSF